MPCSLCKSPHHNKRTCNKIPKNAAEAPRPTHKKLRARINAGARSVGEERALTPPWDPSRQLKRAKSARVIKKRRIVTRSKSCAKQRATAKQFRTYRQQLALMKKKSQNKSRDARAQARARNFIVKCPCNATQPAQKPRLTWAQALFGENFSESRKSVSLIPSRARSAPASRGEQQHATIRDSETVVVKTESHPEPSSALRRVREVVQSFKQLVSAVELSDHTRRCLKRMQLL